MTSNEYKELEERYKELSVKKSKLEKELQEVCDEYAKIICRLKFEPVVD